MKNLYESLLSDEDIDRDLNDMTLIKNRYTVHHSYTPNSNTKLSKLFDIRKLKSYINNNDLVANANFMKNIFKGISNTNIVHAQAINTILGNIEDNANLDIVKQNIDNIFAKFYKIPIDLDVRYWGSTKNLVIVFKSKDLRAQDYYYIRFDKI